MSKIMSAEEAKSLLEWVKPRSDFPDDPVVRALESVIRLHLLLKKNTQTPPKADRRAPSRVAG